MLEIDELKLKIPELTKETNDLREALDIDGAKTQLVSLEEVSARDGFWLDSEKSAAVLKKIKAAKSKISSYKKLSDELDDFITIIAIAQETQDSSLTAEVQESYDSFVKTLGDMRVQTLLSGEYDSNNAIISFHPGAGGVEAQDWAEMLYRMYNRYSANKNYSVKTIDYLDGDEAGIKSATILIEGENAYGYLKSEAGVHRLVRISPFDSSGRRHTSFASLDVMPELDDEADIDIKDEDLRIDTYRAGGAGGQHVNKTDSAVRITHIPTGIVVSCQNERSQHQNKYMAMKMLKSKLTVIKEREHLEKIEDIKGNQKEIAWGSQIRSYVFMPYTLAKDHRTGYEVGNVNGVMDGDLDGFINAYLKYSANDSK